MFIQPNFTFNGVYSRDLGVSIATFDSGIFNDIGTEYTSDISIEHNLVDYNPCYIENFAETNEIQLNLLVYNPITMKPIDITSGDIETLYDWLITDSFASFISDDDADLTYYFKVVRVQKVLSFNREGYLRVTFKPYSRYAYRRREYKIEVNGESTIEIFNLSKQIYSPMIEITNNGSTSTVNKINNMEIRNVNKSETIIVDNLLKLVQNSNGENRFSTCNRKWIELQPKQDNRITLNGNMSVKIICEFPVTL